MPLKNPDGQLSMMLPWIGRFTLVGIGTLLVLASIVILAIALRFLGLGWGGPFVYHADEFVVANPAMNMVRTASWDPDLFLYPSGLIYVERFIITVLHQIDPSVSLDTTTSGGYAGLAWRGASNALPEQFPYFYSGRAFVALVGAFMVVPTYCAARMVSNAIGGLGAAIAIAVAPLAVLNSHYLTTDIPTAALTALTLCFSLRGMTGGRRWLIAAGFAAGLAASTKYNGGLVIVVPVVVLLTSCQPRRLLQRPILTTAGLVVLASVAGFVLLTPAIVFDTSHVWTEGILYQMEVYAAGHPGAEGSDNAIFFLRILWGENGLGPGLAILAGLGLLISVLQHRRADLAVMSFVIAYFALISLPHVRFERNLAPLIPFLSVLVGRTIGWLVDILANPPKWIVFRLRRIPSIAVGLAVIAVTVWPSASAALASDMLLREPDTRTRALDWIEANIPWGATIAREEYTPLISPSQYRVGFVPLLAYRPLAWYRAAGFEYLIASSSQFDRYRGHAPEDAFYRELLTESVILDLWPQPGQRAPRVVVVRLRGVAAGSDPP